MSKVLITGCSSGIGMATALELARAGHTVYATMRNPERASKLREIAEAEKLPLSIHRMDVDSDASVAAAVDGIRERAGRIDALVNNAGIERMGSIEETSMEAFRECMETNYFGAIRCIRAVVPGMRAAGAGVIVNISSVAGRIASAPLTPYSATKWALEALSEGLAQEVKAHGIRVAIVEPGIIDTPMARRIEDEHPSVYPHAKRIRAMFAATLTNPCPPEMVAAAIREIVERDTGKLRHPVGFDAEPFLAWRRAQSDEDWVAWGALDDDAWAENVMANFGFDPRPFMTAAG